MADQQGPIDVTALANANTMADVDSAAAQLNTAIQQRGGGNGLQQQHRDGGITGTGTVEYTKRLEFVDELRGLCLLAMLVYHLFYILGHVLGSEAFKGYFDKLAGSPYVTVTAAMFILISGFVWRYSNSRDPKRSFFILAACALALTVVTVGLLPMLDMRNTAVWFGCLHLLSVGRLLLFLGQRFYGRVKFFGALLGAALSMALYIITSTVGDRYFGFFSLGRLELPARLYESNALCWLGFHTSDFAQWDYFPLLPYLFLFFFGVFLGLLLNPKYKNGNMTNNYSGRDDNFPAFCYRPIVRPLNWLGKHSLAVYMLHMPVVYGIFYLIDRLVSRGA